MADVIRNTLVDLFTGIKDCLCGLTRIVQYKYESYNEEPFDHAKDPVAR